MTVTHIVMFQFPADAPQQTISHLCTWMLSLKDQCLHPSTNKAYIRSCRGGRDNSVQGLQRGMTHVFVVEFDSVADRDYYALKDPVHLRFVEWSEGVVEGVQAIDFMGEDS